jgi:hypothetical protein
MSKPTAKEITLDVVEALSVKLLFTTLIAVAIHSLACGG